MRHKAEFILKFESCKTDIILTSLHC